MALEKKIKSDLISSLLNSMSKSEKRRVDNRTEIAVKIDEAMKLKNISKVILSQRLDKQISEVENWLSGTHNFTIDTLSEIEVVLDAKII